MWGQECYDLSVIQKKKSGWGAQSPRQQVEGARAF